jgi:hypothetical protein
MAWIARLEIALVGAALVVGFELCLSSRVSADDEGEEGRRQAGRRRSFMDEVGGIGDRARASVAGTRREEHGIAAAARGACDRCVEIIAAILLSLGPNALGMGAYRATLERCASPRLAEARLRQANTRTIASRRPDRCCVLLAWVTRPRRRTR